MMISSPGLSKFKTMPVVYEDVILALDSGTLEQLKELSSKRKAVEEFINCSRFVTEAIAREMSGGLTSRTEQDIQKLEQYLPLLENLVFHVCGNGEVHQISSWIADLRIRWSSGLAVQSIFQFQGPKFYQINHLYFEIGMTLFVYGELLRDRALEVLSTDLVQSSTLLRRAAGVYDYLVLVLSTEFWDQERPPEATPTVCNIMSLICLAEAQAAAAIKAEQNGKSQGLLAKLHCGVNEFLSEAINLWQVAAKDCKDISSRLLDFISTCKVLHELMSYKYFAQALKHGDQIGIAIGVLRQTLANAKTHTPKDESWRLVFKQVIDEVTGVLGKYESENDFVWREKIPFDEYLPSPVAAKVVNLIPYQPEKWERTLVFRC